MLLAVRRRNVRLALDGRYIELQALPSIVGRIETDSIAPL